MTKVIDVEAVESVIEAPEAAPQTEKQVVAELIIRVFEDGNMEINVPEGGRELQPFEVETLTRSVSEQMRDARIAQQAVAMFKAKLG
jgi:hypothetical protein